MDGLLNKLLQEGEGVVATAEQKVGELKKVLEAKGVELSDGADFVAILNAAIAAIEGNKEGEGDEPKDESADAAVAASVRVELGVARDADRDTVVKALSDIKGHLGYVPAKEHQKVTARVDALETKEATRNADDLVQGCLSDGTILETDDAQMKWARDRATNDPEGFKALMANAPVIVPQGRTSPPAGAVPKPGGDDEQKLIDKALSDHDGNHKNALIALQSDLMRPHLDAGLTTKAARQRCESSHPKIFGAAA